MVAGEASGDLHGARLATELGRRLPGLEIFGMGGEEMRGAGVEIVADSSEVAVMGLAEVLRILRRARQIFHQLLAEVDRRRPDLAVLIDFPDFNLRLAKQLARRGVPVVYYVSPQLWAWRRRRVETIARVVDQMLVLFPFEVDFYDRHGVEVVHVGHPLVDEVPELPQIWDDGAPPAGEPYRLSLLPGSRRSEVERLLPVMLETVRQLGTARPLEVRLIRATTIPRPVLEEAVARAGVPVEIVEGRQQRFHTVAGSHLALCASGTATLEVGLLGTPMVVLYRLAFWTHLVALLVIRLPWVSLVNLVLEEPAVPELLQRDARPRRIAAEVERLLGDPAEIAAMRRRLAGLRPRLGAGGASLRAAREVAAMLDRGRSDTLLVQSPGNQPIG
jgi:lipid-A-disaccharide synthase